MIFMHVTKVAFVYCGKLRKVAGMGVLNVNKLFRPRKYTAAASFPLNILNFD